MPEYVVIIRKTTDEREKKRIIEDVMYRGFDLVKIEDRAGGSQIAHFQMPEPDPA